MIQLFDPKVPYMQAGKCYKYTLLRTENPQTVLHFFVSNVIEHRTISSNQIYNYSYHIITECKTSDVCDSGMYIWNQMGDFKHSDYYGVRNARIEEMIGDEAKEFVSKLKNKWARSIYL